MKVLLGHRRATPQAEPVCLDTHGTVALLAGPSGAGKSTVTAALLERLGQAGYQTCIVDPEGDYDAQGGLVVLGDAHTVPSIDNALQLLGNPTQSVAVNLLRVPPAERPRFCANLLLRLQALRVATGRPHWLVFEEAHQLFPANWDPAAQSLPLTLDTALAVTVHPDQVAPAFLRHVNFALATGERPDATLDAFARAYARRSSSATRSPKTRRCRRCVRSNGSRLQANFYSILVHRAAVAPAARAASTNRGATVSMSYASRQCSSSLASRTSSRAFQQSP